MERQQEQLHTISEANGNGISDHHDDDDNHNDANDESNNGNNNDDNNGNNGNNNNNNNNDDNQDDNATQNVRDWNYEEFFPRMLYTALQDDTMHEIICWTEDGRAFVILDKHELVNVFLPKHFPSIRSLNSFTRRMNRWGFFKDPITLTLANPLFRRDEPDLMYNIRPRKKTSRHDRQGYWKRSASF